MATCDTDTAKQILCLQEQIQALTNRDVQLFGGIEERDTQIAGLIAEIAVLEAELDSQQVEITVLTGLVDDINSELRSSGVVLRRAGQNAQFYKPAANTDASRMLALRAALIDAEQTPGTAAEIELLVGRFLIPAGVPLRTYAPTASIILTCTDGASHAYDDPEDAGDDWTLFVGDRNVQDFGALPSPPGPGIDVWKAFQAACNALHNYQPYTTVSGRMLRVGKVVVPEGYFFISRSIFISPGATFEGHSAAGTRIILKTGSFNSVGDTTERFAIDFESPEAAVSINNLFYSQVRNITLSDQTPGTNIRGSGIKIQGGQGTSMQDVYVSGFAIRGVVANGCSFTRCWIADIGRGPGLDWGAGGFADILSVEHVNGLGAVDAGTGEVYPALQISTGIFNIGLLTGEENASTPQIFCRAGDIVALTIGSMLLGVGVGGRNHTMLRVTGTSDCVAVTEMTGVIFGTTPIDIGLLVRDDSTHSPAGSGVLYSLGDTSGAYDQRSQLAVKIAGNQVVGARNTGWAAMTGTATKTAIATYTAPAISASPTQAEVQGIADALQALSRRSKAESDALITHGLLGT